MIPTDDLRARPEYETTLREMFAVAANERRFQEADALNYAIAALSALPAGGEPAAWLVEKTGKSSWSGKVETRRDAILGSPEVYREEGFTCRPLVFGDTTPQPSAAECPACKGVRYEPNPKARYWQERADFWRGQAIAHGYNPDATAPAAGKGVDGLLARAAEVVHHDVDCPAIGGNGDDDCRCDAVAFLRDLEAALTRQPVAGDGWRPIESAPREKLVLLANEHNGAVGCGHMDARGAWWWSHHPTHWQPLLAAPAATPTDGGEGKA